MEEKNLSTVASMDIALNVGDKKKKAKPVTAGTMNNQTREGFMTPSNPINPNIPFTPNTASTSEDKPFGEDAVHAYNMALWNALKGENTSLRKKVEELRGVLGISEETLKFYDEAISLNPMEFVNIYEADKFAVMVKECISKIQSLRSEGKEKV